MVKQQNITEFDLKMIGQSQRLACIKAATRMGENTGGTSAQVIADAQTFFNWVTMTDDERQQMAPL